MAAAKNHSKQDTLSAGPASIACGRQLEKNNSRKWTIAVVEQIMTSSGRWMKSGSVAETKTSRRVSAQVIE
ncbi:unnamed protein product [Heligmosomoides polygyrus]|uniref:Uncharacterized protein n=1 Tax=Heligmosomoides polygyrus TaxID=6339 RepID=A0A183FWW2_HELPZ|nr:unnamed protein product [Heligmosomoides polygyrus]